MTRYEALTAVRDFYQSQQAMADALNVSQPTVWRWLNQSRQMPAEFVLAAEALSDVSRHDLRPDIYPRESLRDRRIADRFCGIDRRMASDRVSLAQAS